MPTLLLHNAASNKLCGSEAQQELEACCEELVCEDSLGDCMACGCLQVDSNGVADAGSNDCDQLPSSFLLTLVSSTCFQVPENDDECSTTFPLPDIPGNQLRCVWVATRAPDIFNEIFLQFLFVTVRIDTDHTDCRLRVTLQVPGPGLLTQQGYRKIVEQPCGQYDFTFGPADQCGVGQNDACDITGATFRIRSCP